MPWNKGFTKETHPSVAKTSATMKARNIDNFKNWRKTHSVHYAMLPHSGDLAEYIGAVLGDGNIEKCSRTERLVIVGDLKKPGFINHYAALTEKLFKKKPTVKKVTASNGVRISLYQKYISERLDIPCGDKSNFDFILPDWINENEKYLIRLLRGLFEAEGSLSIHLPTCTYNLRSQITTKAY